MFPMPAAPAALGANRVFESMLISTPISAQ
jgi:hypothetical protein